MSISGTWQTTAPNNSGRCTITVETSSPPLEPPMMPSCLVVVRPPAVGPPHDPKLFGRGRPALARVGAHRLEIVISMLALVLQRRVMPGRPEFAAAADIGHHIDAAMRQPQAAHIGAIARRQRN